jgi:hypothetical protein
LAHSAAEIQKRGWRQGSILSEDFVSQLYKECEIPCARLLNLKSPLLFFKWYRRRIAQNQFFHQQEKWALVSQDCDVVQASFEKEPWVELIRMIPIEKPGSYQNLKSARQLEFKDGENAFQLDIRDRCVVSRKLLCSWTPEEQLLPESIGRIRLWISNRYVRAAFPDAFNARLANSQKKLFRKLKKNKDQANIDSIYVFVSDDEKAEGEEYEIKIAYIVNAKHFANVDYRAKAQKIADMIEASFAIKDSIDVLECDLISTSQFTLEQLTYYKRWDFDEISLRKGSVDDLDTKDR